MRLGICLLERPIQSTSFIGYYFLMSGSICLGCTNPCLLLQSPWGIGIPAIVSTLFSEVYFSLSLWRLVSPFECRKAWAAGTEIRVESDCIIRCEHLLHLSKVPILWDFIQYCDEELEITQASYLCVVQEFLIFE